MESYCSFSDEENCRYPFKYHYIKDKSDVSSVISSISNHNLLGVDTETSSLDPYNGELLLFQIGFPDEIFVLNCLSIGNEYIGQRFSSFMCNNSVTKIFQNVKFDYKYILTKLGLRINGVFDTFLADRILSAGRRGKASLDKLAAKYLGLHMSKSVRQSFTKYRRSWLFSCEEIEYAAKDVAVLFKIADIQRKRLSVEKMAYIADIEFKAALAIAEMELNGILLNEEAWVDIIKGEEQLREESEARMNLILSPGLPQPGLFEDICSVNLGSQKQILESFRGIGVNLPDTSSKTLKFTDHEAAIELLKYRKHDKILTSFGTNFILLKNSSTGRIHPDFQQCGADTGRMSCTNPNMQQIPRDQRFRSCFIARDGYRIITSDYSQIELRILTELSQDPAFLEAFNSGWDLHSSTAARMFDVPLDLVKKEMRQEAKTINFGIVYGMSAHALASLLRISIQEAQKKIDLYFSIYPSIESFLEKIADEALKLGYAVTPLGRKRYFSLPDKSDPGYSKKLGHIRRQAKNHPIQGGNADMTKLSLYSIYNALLDYDAFLINTVHDEIVVEASFSCVDEVVDIINELMIEAGKQVVKSVPVLVSTTVGSHWSK
ncbi:MAG: hypothetical protein GY861_21490 [bacterium]|nr:hypothetical protein [bacterium]